MFDNVSKLLVEQYSPDFVSWLIGEPIALTELSPSELLLEPIRAEILPEADKACPVLPGAFCLDSAAIG